MYIYYVLEKIVNKNPEVGALQPTIILKVDFNTSVFPR